SSVPWNEDVQGPVARAGGPGPARGMRTVMPQGCGPPPGGPPGAPPPPGCGIWPPAALFAPSGIALRPGPCPDFSAASGPPEFNGFGSPVEVGFGGPALMSVFAGADWLPPQPNVNPPQNHTMTHTTRARCTSNSP